MHHPCRPLPGQPPHLWPLLIPTVDTHRKTFLRTLQHSLSPAACQEGHTVVTQTARSLPVEALKLSCPRQSLPGSRIPEGLHCHQQSFSSMHSLRIAGRNALCSFSFVPFAYLYPKHAHKHFTHESNCISCFVYLIHITVILIMLPISNANRNLYKRAEQQTILSCPDSREDIMFTTLGQYFSSCYLMRS